MTQAPASTIQPVSFSLFGDQVSACAYGLDSYATAIDLMRRLRAPLSVSWDVTMDCHFQCAHCFNMSGPGRGRNELDAAESMALARQLIELEVLNVCLCGGEPLLRPDLCEIARTLADARIVVSMVSNGYYLDERKAEELAAAGVRFLQISIDGATAESHERLRGKKGSFERAVAAARAVAATGSIELAVAFCPTRFNVDEFPAYVDLVRELGTRQIRMMPVLRMGRAELYRDELLPTPDQMALFRQNVQKKTLECIDAGITVELGDPLEHLYLFPRNDAKLFILCIRSNGDLTISGYLPLVLGNVRERPIRDYWEAGLDEIWRHPYVKRVCDSITNLEELRDLDPLPWVEGDLHLDLFDPAASPQTSVRKIMKPTPRPEGFKIRSEKDDVMSVFPLDFDCGRQVHFLNPNATFLYRRCDGRRGVPELTAEFMAAYPELDEVRARQDVESCLSAMAELGVIAWKRNGATPPPRAGLVVRFADETDFKAVSAFICRALAERKAGKDQPLWYLPVDVAGYYHPVAVRTRQFHSREVCYLLERGGKLLGVASLTFMAPPLTSAQIGCLAARARSRREQLDLSGVLLDGLVRAGKHLGLTKLKCGLPGIAPEDPLADFLFANGFQVEARLEDELGPGGHFSVLSRKFPTQQGATS